MPEDKNRNPDTLVPQIPKGAPRVTAPSESHSPDAATWGPRTLPPLGLGGGPGGASLLPCPGVPGVVSHRSGWFLHGWE